MTLLDGEIDWHRQALKSRIASWRKLPPGRLALLLFLLAGFPLHAIGGLAGGVGAGPGCRRWPGSPMGLALLLLGAIALRRSRPCASGLAQPGQPCGSVLSWAKDLTAPPFCWRNCSAASAERKPIRLGMQRSQCRAY